MATMQDLIQTMVQGQQLLLAKRAQETSESNSKVQRLQLLGQLAEGIVDPEMRKALVKTGVDWGLGDQATVKGILDNVAPKSGVVQQFYEQQGVLGAQPGENKERGRQAASRAATGAMTAGTAQNKVMETALGAAQGQMDANAPFTNALATHLLTNMLAGMSPGKMALDEAAARLPGSEQTQAARMGYGLVPTAAQSMANRLGWGQVAAQTATAEAQMATQKDISEQDNLTRLKIAALSGSGQSGPAINDLLQTLGTMVNTLESKKGTLSQYEINLYGATINNAARALNAKIPGFSLPQLPSTFVQTPAGPVEIIDSNAITQSAGDILKGLLKFGSQQAGKQ